MDAEELTDRTDRFAAAITRLCAELPRNGPLDNILRQLGDSSASVGANYRSTCRARSRREFVSRIAVVTEEADETVYWLNLLLKSGLVQPSAVQDLLQEGQELRAIFARSYGTARANLHRTFKATSRR
jgi:four helix bundle protein